MASRGELVLFEAEDEKRYYKWLRGRVDLDPIAGAITIHTDPASRFSITVPVSEITDYEIVERKDISTFGPMLGASLSDSTGALPLLLAPIAFIDTAIAKNTLFPTIKLTQAAIGDQEQGWTIYLRSRRRGRNGQIATREMAHRIVAFLRQGGYCGPIPDSSGERQLNGKHKQVGEIGKIGEKTAINAIVFVILAGSISGLLAAVLDAYGAYASGRPYTGDGTLVCTMCSIPLGIGGGALGHLVGRLFKGEKRELALRLGTVVGAVLGGILALGISALVLP